MQKIKISIIFILLYSLTSCGFKPLYATHNQLAIDNFLNSILIINTAKKEPIRSNENINKIGNTLARKIIFQTLVTELKVKTIKDNDINYWLQINNIHEYDTPLDLDRDGQASEYNYTINLTATLLDKNKKILFNKSYSSSVNLNISDSYYASQVSKRSYREILAKNIALELKNYLLTTILNSSPT